MYNIWLQALKVSVANFVLKNNFRLIVSHSSSNRCWEMSVIFVYIQIFLIAIDFILFCCCIFGNFIVIFVILREKKVKSKSSYHILSVAVADFIVGVFIIPFNLATVSWNLRSKSQWSIVLIDRNSPDHHIMYTFASSCRLSRSSRSKLRCFHFWQFPSIAIGRFASQWLIK